MFSFSQLIEEIKKQRYLIVIILSLTILITISYLFYRILTKENAQPLPKKDEYPKIEINWTTLNNRFLQESELFEKISPFQPSEEKPLGRENPFLPYESGLKE